MSEIPEDAVEALENWLGERTGSLLHAWISEDDRSMLAVVASVRDEAFDSETDAYDVDSIQLHMLSIEAGDDGWSVEEDNELTLGALFGDLANRFVEEEGPV